jgi:hypothetical protein
MKFFETEVNHRRQLFEDELEKKRKLTAEYERVKA